MADVRRSQCLACIYPFFGGVMEHTCLPSKWRIVPLQPGPDLSQLQAMFGSDARRKPLQGWTSNDDASFDAYSRGDTE